MFSNTFGTPRAVYQKQPGAVTLTCGLGACNAAQVRTAVGTHPERVLWVAGDLDLDSAGDIGSALEPVALVVQGSIQFVTASTVYGVVYSQAGDWDSAGTGEVRGAAIAEGSFTGTTSCRLRLRPRRPQPRATGDRLLRSGSRKLEGLLMATRRIHERGVSLIEALVALVVMTFGTLAVLGVQSTLRMNGDTARQRAEAVRIAQETIERRRSFAKFDTGAEARFTDIADVAADRRRQRQHEHDLPAHREEVEISTDPASGP